MQFLFIISHDDAFIPSETLFAEIGAWIVKMERKGIRMYGNPLQAADSARTVRVRQSE